MGYERSIENISFRPLTCTSGLAILCPSTKEIAMHPDRFDAYREQMLRELASDLADLVESGDMTQEQANQWYSDKADQWTEAA